ncbi:MAG: glycosyl hydrolase [Chitinophagaceae bacterium]|nr:MAG: glycosyl hydrolase [Chitinophagaceae bacterium]
MKKLVRSCLLSALALSGLTGYAQADMLFRNNKATIEQRAADLVSRMTLPEKISLLGYRSKAVDRLGIPAYNWWNEALHGVARAGQATVFPQAIGMAASFDNELLFEVASVISTEARAKYNLAVAKERRLQYMGLTFWSPNINIFRDPRWGRGQETYGEDPFLTATMGTAFVRGLQGNDPVYLKTSACAKHFAVHSGPEAGRHTFNAVVSEKDLRETYLYAFRRLVDAGVESVMCGYNRVNDEPCCTGNTLLKNILRNEWKFGGHVVTDCWALEDIWLRHKVLPNSVVTAAEAIKAGVNLDCSNLLQDDVMKAVEQGLLTEAQINAALVPQLRTQLKLGFYDEKKDIPYSSYGADSISNAYHTALARRMASGSMVLLKNKDNLLPLKTDQFPAIMIAGPVAASLDALLGNYHGISAKAVNFVEGIVAAVGPGTRVEYDQGADFTDTTRFGGTWAAGNADITLAFVGFTPVYEGEEGDAFLADGKGDRNNISLPASHIAYIKALRKNNSKPIVAVITGGSAVDLGAIEPYVDAILLAWYPGEQGGNALADVLFGKVSPGGRLPVTFYNSFADLPDYGNYAMQGRTYRYFQGKVLYPFGYGLSYGKFSYSSTSLPTAVTPGQDSIRFAITVKNDAATDADETVQVYISYPSLPGMPARELKAFRKLFVKAGSAVSADFIIPVAELQKWDMAEKKWKLYPGTYRIIAGSNSLDKKLESNFTIKKSGK